MKPSYNPNRIDCRCGCCGVSEYHEAGARIRGWLREKLTAALEPVTIGKRTIGRIGFGESRKPKARGSEEWNQHNLPVNSVEYEAMV